MDDRSEIFEFMSDLTTSLCEFWRARGNWFVRFKDGDKMNFNDFNLEVVSVVDMVTNFTDWTADWDIGLSKAERQLVNDSTWRAHFLTAASIAPEVFVPDYFKVVPKDPDSVPLHLLVAEHFLIPQCRQDQPLPELADV